MIAARRINRLPHAVADAIAAGEVIERPASVVKELMENAFDAGARRIDVDVDGGGLVRIQVADDGSGIAAEDLELAVTRHATSKISQVDDLQSVATLGFRGEALASIAAVSDLRIVSRLSDAMDAHAIRVRFGDVVERSATAGSAGTLVEVCELFAATPVRLRFLRATATEAAAAVRVAADLALAHPAVAVRCYTDGRVTLRSPGGTLTDALVAVYGSRVERELVALGSDGPIRVSGAVSAPHAHRAGRSGLVLAVNRRRVYNRSLIAAVEGAYQGLIPNGRHPFGLVTITIDPAVTDVNVHPTKREVRFSDERAVFSAVQRAVWHAIRSAPVAPYRTGEVYAPHHELLGQTAVHEALGPAEMQATLLTSTAIAPRRTDTTPALSDLAPLHALGQANNQWLLASGSGAVVLVDPHAAHEKVLYSEMLDSLTRSQRGDTQLLLMPQLIECDTEQMERWHRHGDVLARWGFELDQFGPMTLRCSGVPQGVHDADLDTLIRDLLDAVEDGAPSERVHHRVAALLACHSAVRLGDHLEPVEQQQLLERLVQTPGGMSCPHGRPTVLVLSDSDLRSAFRRPAR